MNSAWVWGLGLTAATRQGNAGAVLAGAGRLTCDAAGVLGASTRGAHAQLLARQAAPPSRPPRPARSHAQGLCTAADCPYLHVNLPPDAPVCAAFLRGHCPAGADCGHKHYTPRMVKEERRLEAARRGQQPAGGSGGGGAGTEVCSARRAGRGGKQGWLSVLLCLIRLTAQGAGVQAAAACCWACQWWLALARLQCPLAAGVATAGCPLRRALAARSAAAATLTPRCRSPSGNAAMRRRRRRRQRRQGQVRRVPSGGSLASLTSFSRTSSCCEAAWWAVSREPSGCGMPLLYGVR